MTPAHPSLLSSITHHLESSVYTFSILTCWCLVRDVVEGSVERPVVLLPNELLSGG